MFGDHQVVKTCGVFFRFVCSPRLMSVTLVVLSENKIKQRVDADSIISAVSSLFSLDLQRSISLLLN